MIPARDVRADPLTREAGPSDGSRGYAHVVPQTSTRFAMPKPVRITGRTSSITNSFVNGIIPVIPPSEADIDEALGILGMTDEVVCAYCGDDATEWDHLRPLVIGKQPVAKALAEPRGDRAAHARCRGDRRTDPRADRGRRHAARAGASR